MAAILTVPCVALADDWDSWDDSFETSTYNYDSYYDTSDYSDYSSNDYSNNYSYDSYDSGFDYGFVDSEDGYSGFYAGENVIDSSNYEQDDYDYADYYNDLDLAEFYADFDEFADADSEFKTQFRYEDGDVVILAVVSEVLQLPKNAEIQVERMSEGTVAYEAAKAATMNSLGTSEYANYNFYDVKFMVDGEEVKVADEDASVKVHFKSGLKAVSVEKNKAKDVTGQEF